MISNIYKKFELLTAPIRVDPDFMVIGAQKAGTTTLFGYFKEHPQVAMPRVKEIHFYDLNYDRGQNFYRRNFLTTPMKVISEVRQGKCITGEATPYYLFHPDVPSRVFKHHPSIRLIAILRDPVDRAISHFKHNVRMKRERRSFQEAIESDGLYADTTITSSDQLQHFSYLQRGRYSKQLDRWFEYFPKEQMLILDFTQLVKDPNGTLHKVYSFLEIKMININNAIQKNKSIALSDLEYDREAMIRYFRQDVLNLRENFNLDFQWMARYADAGKSLNV
jgi:Sulfotransferase domain.